MKICIITHSKTGNTRKMANLAADILQSEGHSVDLVDLQTQKPVEGWQPGNRFAFEITNQPDIGAYDVILAGGPVWAFSISPVIQKCIMQFPPLRGKTFIPFTTMGFRYKWLGGDRSLKQLNRSALEKGAVIKPGIVACGHGTNKESNLIAAAKLLAGRIGA